MIVPDTVPPLASPAPYPAPSRSTVAATPAPAAELVLSARGVVRGLAVVIALLVAAHVVAVFMRDVLHRDFVYGLVSMFDMNQETNVPTWYSSFSLLLCAGLLWFIAAAARRSGAGFVGHWLVLAGGFLFLSVDEAATIHEMLGRMARARLHATGYTYFAFVVPSAIVCAVLLVAYLRFLEHLPGGTRWRMLAAGALYVGSAVVTDSITDQVADVYGVASLAAELARMIEEVGEMSGVLLFIHVLLSYMQRAAPELRVRMGTSR